ncbi:MAG: 16S rRNA (cytidine(1402)-2'-O)-methyltransferase [Actinomycetes bacterium]
MAGRIVLAATPIGNVRDGSARLWEALATADVVAAEDTRALRDLARRAGIEVAGKVVAVHDHNEAQSARALVESARSGATVVVVSDAGMPTVSDPGLRVVREAVAADVAVEVLPGPSAVLAALALSGLPTDRFCFEGFLSRKAGERRSALAALTGEPRTMVFFEAPHRLAETLADMAEAFGPERQASVSREITKTHEETRRGSLAELAAWARTEPRGEMVVVVAGRPADAPSLDEVVAEAVARVTAGERAKDVATDLAATTGIGSREIYAALLAARGT